MRVALNLVLLLSAALTASADPALTAAQYHDRLQHLQQLTSACDAAIGTYACSAKAVDPAFVVRLDGRERRVDLSWLADCLEKAKEPHPTAEDRKRTQQLLKAAESRLTQDIADLERPRPDTRTTLNSETQRTAPILQSVLARSEFRHVQQPSWLGRIFDRLMDWLTRAFARMAGRGNVSPWAVRVIAGLILLTAVTVLARWYLRQMRRRPLPGTSASERGGDERPAARWQVLLQRSEALAMAQQWREAIHLLYWAAISRLESLGRWSNDRARTPREYVGLLEAWPNQEDLAALTRTLERVWYGSQAAREDEFVAARVVFARLGRT